MKWITCVLLFSLAAISYGEEERQPSFRIFDSFRAGYLDFIIQEFERRGYEIAHPSYLYWNVTWAVAYHPSSFSALKDWQRVNNMPAIVHLTTKDNLHRAIEKMKKEHSDDAFSFWPESYNLEDPKQFDFVRKIFEDHENSGATDPLIFIIKKPMRPRGLGVHLVHNVTEIDELKLPNSTAYPLDKTKPIAQRYITDVLTVAGHKVTFRVYAAITSMDPLRVYVFPSGLGRICSRRYNTDVESLRDQWVHIDSINLNEENEKEFFNSVNGSDLHYEGLRVETQYYLKRLETLGITSSASKVWTDIQNVILMSFISAEKVMHSEFMKLCVDKRKRRTYPFELVGFDILLDKNLKPWLLEINNTPSMAPHTTMENEIKQRLLRELFDLVDIQNFQFNETESIVNEKWNIIKSLPPNYEFVSSSGNKFPASQIKTREDVWAIVETELENARAGGFQLLFPVAEGKKFLKYLTNRRNDLLVSWKQSGMTLDKIRP